MLKLKLLTLCVLVCSVAYVLSGSNDGGAGSAYEAAKNGEVKKVIEIAEGDVKCGSTECGSGSFAHYYACCGAQGHDCCFALQMWVYITMALITLISIISCIISLICCCCKK